MNTLSMSYNIEAAMQAFVNGIQNQGGASIMFKPVASLGSPYKMVSMRFDVAPDHGYMASYEDFGGHGEAVCESTEDIYALRSLFLELAMRIVERGNSLPNGYDDEEMYGLYIGAWVEDGKVIGDISRHFTHEDEVLEFSIANHQRAYYDIAAGKSVSVNNAEVTVG